MEEVCTANEVPMSNDREREQHWRRRVKSKLTWRSLRTSRLAQCSSMDTCGTTARQDDCRKRSLLPVSHLAHLQGAIVTSYNRAAVTVQIQSGLEPENTSRSALHAATSSRSCNTPINHKQRHSVAANVPISSRPGPAQHILAASVRMPFSAFRGGAQEICAWRHAGGLQPMRMQRSTSAEVCPSTERALDQSSQPSHHSCG